MKLALSEIYSKGMSNFRYIQSMVRPSNPTVIRYGALLQQRDAEYPLNCRPSNPVYAVMPL